MLGQPFSVQGKRLAPVGAWCEAAHRTEAAQPYRCVNSAGDSLRAGSYRHVPRELRGQIPDLIKQAGGSAWARSPGWGGGWTGEVQVMRGKTGDVTISRVNSPCGGRAAIRSSAAGGTERRSLARMHGVIA